MYGYATKNHSKIPLMVSWLDVGGAQNRRKVCESPSFNVVSTIIFEFIPVLGKIRIPG